MKVAFKMAHMSQIGSTNTGSMVSGSFSYVRIKRPIWITPAFQSQKVFTAKQKCARIHNQALLALLIPSFCLKLPLLPRHSHESICMSQNAGRMWSVSPYHTMPCFRRTLRQNDAYSNVLVPLYQREINKKAWIKLFPKIMFCRQASLPWVFLPTEKEAFHVYTTAC